MPGIPIKQEDLGCLKLLLSTVVSSTQNMRWQTRRVSLNHKHSPQKVAEKHWNGTLLKPGTRWDPRNGVTKKIRHFCFCQMGDIPFQLRPQSGSSPSHQKEWIGTPITKTQRGRHILQDARFLVQKSKQRGESLCKRRLIKTFFSVERKCLKGSKPAQEIVDPTFKN